MARPAAVRFAMPLLEDLRKPLVFNGDEPVASLTANCAWNITSNAVFAACQWAMLMVMAKRCSQAAVGQFTLAMAITSPVFLFSTLQLRSMLATDVRDQYTFSEYFRLRLITTAAACGAVALLCTMPAYSTGARFAIGFAAASKAFESLSDIFHGRLQKYEQMSRIAIGVIARGILSLLFLTAIVLTTGNAILAMSGLVFGSALVGIGFDFNNGSPGLRAVRRVVSTPPGRLSSPHSLQRLWTLSRAALPLGIVILLATLTANVPRYFVDYYLGDVALGQFAASAYVMAAMHTLVSSIGQTAMARLAWLYSAGDIKGLIRVLARFVALAALAGGAGIAASIVGGRQILTILYRAEYAREPRLFTVLMTAATVMSIASILSYAVMAVRCIKSQLPLFAAVLAGASVGCFLLVPRYGLLGAAYSLLIGVSVQVIGCVIVLAVVLGRTRRPAVG